MTGQFITAQVIRACLLGLDRLDGNDYRGRSKYLAILEKLANELEHPLIEMKVQVPCSQEDTPTMRGYAIACKYGVLEARAFDLVDEMKVALAEAPTELEMHRAAYEAVKDAGFDSPEELLAAYKHLAEQDNAKQRKVDELISELTRWKAIKRKPWTGAEIGRVWKNSHELYGDIQNMAAFHRVVRHIEACQGLEGAE